MPRAMVHPRLKRILSETETASPTPAPDVQKDTGRPEAESEEPDVESEEKEKDGGSAAPGAPAESQSSMEISDEDARTVEDVRDEQPATETYNTPINSWHDLPTPRGANASPASASASHSTPRAARGSKSATATAPSPASQATKETSPAPPSTSASTNRSPAPQAQPRLKIRLKLGARPQPQPQPPAEGVKATRRRKGKGKAEPAALTFSIPSRNPTEASEASSQASAESEEADDADAESEDDLDAPAVLPDGALSIDVDSRVAADDMESEGDLAEDDEGEMRSGSRGRMTARQAVLASMVGAEHVELEAPTSSRKKNLTSEELALRREETARKRKNMSEKKLEDEKTETINRLLKKQSSRSRAKRSALLSSVVPTPLSPHSGEEGESDTPAPTMPGPAWRWVSSHAGIRLGIPSEAASPPVPPPVPATEPAMCDVAGCGAQRKYRLVRDFQRGACGMEHLKVLNEGLVAG